RLRQHHMLGALAHAPFFGRRLPFPLRVAHAIDRRKKLLARFCKPVEHLRALRVRHLRVGGGERQTDQQRQKSPHYFPPSINVRNTTWWAMCFFRACHMTRGVMNLAKPSSKSKRLSLSRRVEPSGSTVSV